MHVHGAHSHASHASSSAPALRWSLIATLVFVAVQAAAGLFAGSLALLSDAGHNLADSLALGLAMIGVWLQAKPADESRTYGYGRGGILAAFVNALILVGLSAWLFVEAILRMGAPRPVDEEVMIGVAAAGIVLNVGVMWALHRHSHDVNIRAASLHMLSDALGSVAIIIGAVAIRFTGLYIIDPILSVLIGILILWSSMGIIMESLNVLLEGMPRGMRLSDVQKTIQDVDGILDVHDLHVWSLGSSSHALSCHALIEDMPPSESNELLQRVQQALAGRHGIRHTTVQFEHVHCPLAEGCRMHTEPSGAECRGHH
jgi:cobalt-zinc-cadmium efflux system protein